MGAGDMPFLIGQCCTDQIIIPDDSGSSNLSGKNEVIDFTNETIVTIAWNSTRIARFGDAAVIYVEVKGEDNIYRHANVEIVPDDADNTTEYTINFGGVTTGRIIIS